MLCVSQAKYREVADYKYNLKRFKSRDNKGIQVSLDGDHSNIKVGLHVIAKNSNAILPTLPF